MLPEICWIDMCTIINESNRIDQGENHNKIVVIHDWRFFFLHFFDVFFLTPFKFLRKFFFESSFFRLRKGLNRLNRSWLLWRAFLFLIDDFPLEIPNSCAFNERANETFVFFFYLNSMKVVAMARSINNKTAFKSFSIDWIRLCKFSCSVLYCIVLYCNS